MKTTIEKKETKSLSLFQGERTLVLLGLLGFVLAGIVAIIIGIKGSVTLPEGNLHSAFSFNAALAIYILSIAAILPLSGYSEKKKTAARMITVVLSLDAYFIETIQHYRGINPRFSKVGNVADQIFNGLFGLDALLIVIFTTILAVSFFRLKQVDRPLMILSIRYAFLSVFLSFVGGFIMIALRSRMIGDSGNLTVLHGLGFHALQALPLIAWFLEKGKTFSLEKSRRFIHIAGIAWMLSVVFIGWQTLQGKTVVELSTLPVIAGILLVFYTVLCIQVIIKSTRSGNQTYHG